MFEDHYWIIAGDETQVWSSRRVGYYPVDDVDYVVWLGETFIGPDGGEYPNKPTHIANEQELSDVLETQGLQGPIVKPKQVYAEATRRKMLVTGHADIDDFNEAIMRGLRDAGRLNNKQASGATLTTAEQARKIQLEQIDAAFDAIDAKADALIAMSPIPIDYKDDVHWT